MPAACFPHTGFAGVWSTCGVHLSNVNLPNPDPADTGTHSDSTRDVQGSMTTHMADSSIGTAVSSIQHDRRRAGTDEYGMLSLLRPTHPPRACPRAYGVQCGVNLPNVNLPNPDPADAPSRACPRSTPGCCAMSCTAGPVRYHHPWTIFQQDGPNHLGVWCNANLEHEVARTTSDCVPLAGKATRRPLLPLYLLMVGVLPGLALVNCFDSCETHPRPAATARAVSRSWIVL